jgi:hypothetical protein
MYVLAGSNRTAVVAVPLFYPILDGCKVAVVSLASRSSTTWLAKLAGNAELADWTKNEVFQWWTDFLRAILGFKLVERDVRKV